MQIKRCVAPLKGQPTEKARITNHQWHLSDHKRERSLIIRQSESPPKIYSILTTNPQYPHKSSLEDVLKVLDETDNLQKPNPPAPFPTREGGFQSLSPLRGEVWRGVCLYIKNFSNTLLDNPELVIQQLILPPA